MTTTTEEPKTLAKRYSGAELCAALGCELRDLRTWSLRDGFPRHGKTKGAWYDLREVQDWLVSQGLAKFEELHPESQAASSSPNVTGGIEIDEHGRRVCRTYAELCNAIGRPQRVVQRWATEPGFPGTPGTPGRRDGYFPVDEIQAWSEARFSRIDTRDAELQEAKKRLALLEIQEQELDARRRLGQLLDFSEVSAFYESCVVNAKAVLGQIPDEVLSMLPAQLSDEVRNDIFRKVSRRIDDSLAEVAALIEGDTDDTADGDGE